MATGKFLRPLSRFLMLTVGISLCLIPSTVDARFAEQTEIPAVSAPSPLVQSVAPWAAYDSWNGLLSKYGLTQAQRHNLISRMDSQLEARLLAGAVSPGELEYRALPGYRQELLERYRAYAAEHPDLAPEQVVLQVNMSLDRPFYDQVTTVSDPDDLTVLVNKHFALSSKYDPAVENLGANYGTGALRPQAAQAFRAMADAAWADGFSLQSVSAYRSYRTQKTLYNSYLSQSTREKVDRYSARPGHSEHQTGLAVDINVASTSAHFENTAEYAWLIQHCADYGFILRYPQDKEHITGYRFEPWHYRYVGVEIARYCMEQGLAYEEYVASLPADGKATLPAISYQGRFLELEQSPLFFNGNLYLPAGSLARLLGWSVEESMDSAALTLQRGYIQLNLVPGTRYRSGLRTLPLSSAALALDNSLYLTLNDLCSILGLRAESTVFGLELTDVS